MNQIQSIASSQYRSAYILQNKLMSKYFLKKWDTCKKTGHLHQYLLYDLLFVQHLRGLANSAISL